MDNDDSNQSGPLSPEEDEAARRIQQAIVMSGIDSSDDDDRPQNAEEAARRLAEMQAALRAQTEPRPPLPRPVAAQKKIPLFDDDDEPDEEFRTPPSGRSPDGAPKWICKDWEREKQAEADGGRKRPVPKIQEEQLSLGRVQPNRPHTKRTPPGRGAIVGPRIGATAPSEAALAAAGRQGLPFGARNNNLALGGGRDSGDGRRNPGPMDARCPLGRGPPGAVIDDMRDDVDDLDEEEEIIDEDDIYEDESDEDVNGRRKVAKVPLRRPHDDGEELEERTPSPPMRGRRPLDTDRDRREGAVEREAIGGRGPPHIAARPPLGAAMLQPHGQVVRVPPMPRRPKNDRIEEIEEGEDPGEDEFEVNDDDLDDEDEDDDEDEEDEEELLSAAVHQPPLPPMVRGYGRRHQTSPQLSPIKGTNNLLEMTELRSIDLEGGGKVAIGPKAGDEEEVIDDSWLGKRRVRKDDGTENSYSARTEMGLTGHSWRANVYMEEKYISMYQTDRPMDENDIFKREASARLEVDLFKWMEDEPLKIDLTTNRGQQIKMYSETMWARGVPWRIMIDRQVPGFIGFFLQAGGIEDEPERWANDSPFSVYAMFELMCRNPHEGEEDLRRPLKWEFNNRNTDYGFSQLFRIDAFTGPKMYLAEWKNTVVFEVRVKPAPPASHIYMNAKLPWKSRERTGCVGLTNQGATCYMNTLLQTYFFCTPLRSAVFQLTNPADLEDEPVPKDGGESTREGSPSMSSKSSSKDSSKPGGRTSDEDEEENTESRRRSRVRSKQQPEVVEIIEEIDEIEVLEDEDAKEAEKRNLNMNVMGLLQSAKNAGLDAEIEEAKRQRAEREAKEEGEAKEEEPDVKRRRTEEEEEEENAAMGEKRLHDGGLPPSSTTPRPSPPDSPMDIVGANAPNVSPEIGGSPGEVYGGEGRAVAAVVPTLNLPLHIGKKSGEITIADSGAGGRGGGKSGLIFNLSRVFYQMQFSDEAPETKQLTTAFGWTDAEAMMQHDVQELNRVLLDKMKDKMAGSDFADLIPQLFSFKMRYYVRCLDVEYTSTKDEDMYDVQLQVQAPMEWPDNRPWTVQEAFKLFTAEENLDGDNKYNAEMHGLQRAARGSNFVNLPRILHIQLMRFSIDYNSPVENVLKNHSRMIYDDRINLNEFVDPKELKDGDDYTYYLHAVLVHKGETGNAGHYIAFVNLGLGQKYARWMKFDDDVVSEVSWREAVPANYGGVNDHTKGHTFGEVNVYAFPYTTAYMLVYVRKDAVGMVTRDVPADTIPPAVRAIFDREEDVRRKKRELEAYLNKTMPFFLLTDVELSHHEGVFDLFDDTLLENTQQLRFLKSTPMIDLPTEVDRALNAGNCGDDQIRLWQFIESGIPERLNNPNPTSLTRSRAARQLHFMPSDRGSPPPPQPTPITIGGRRRHIVHVTKTTTINSYFLDFACTKRPVILYVERIPRDTPILDPTFSLFIKYYERELETFHYAGHVRTPIQGDTLDLERRVKEKLKLPQDLQLKMRVELCPGKSFVVTPATWRYLQDGDILMVEEVRDGEETEKLPGELTFEHESSRVTIIVQERPDAFQFRQHDMPNFPPINIPISLNQSVRTLYRNIMTVTEHNADQNNWGILMWINTAQPRHIWYFHFPQKQHDKVRQLLSLKQEFDPRVRNRFPLQITRLRCRVEEITTEVRCCMRVLFVEAGGVARETMLFPERDWKVIQALNEARSMFWFRPNGTGVLRMVMSSSMGMRNRRVVCIFAPHDDVMVAYERSKKLGTEIRIEEVPEDQIKLARDEMLLPVSLMKQGIDTFTLASSPFLIKIKQGERWAEIAERLYKRTNWDLEKFKTVEWFVIRTARRSSRPASLARINIEEDVIESETLREQTPSPPPTPRASFAYGGGADPSGITRFSYANYNSIINSLRTGAVPYMPQHEEMFWFYLALNQVADDTRREKEKPLTIKD